MKGLPKVDLPQAAGDKLAEYQRDLDAVADYPKRVERAKARWKALNRMGNPAFDAVKKALTAMCSGARRCVYCEDSLADEVEHFWPKSLYPEKTFLWLNHLYACGPCNGPKNNKFAVFTPGNTTPTNVARPKGAPIVPPVAGALVLIDPRAEDPCDYLALELRDTFFFVERAPSGTVAFERAKYTIDTLRLNTNEYLPKARQQAYQDYKAHLSQYRLKIEQGAPRRHLRCLQEDLRGRAHPTVWSEMKRQHESIPELATLFKAIPQALDW